MVKTKQEVCYKQKLREIFTSKRPQLLKKMLAVGVGLSLMVASMPLGGQSAYADVTGNTMFITKDALIDLCDNTNSGEGLLASATENENAKLLINFGTRPTGVVNYYTDNGETPGEVGDETSTTPITWLIAGKDGNDGLVLYSEEPLIGCDKLSNQPNTSVFQVSDFNGEYQDGFGNYTGGGEAPKTVYMNHWGASNLRSKLKGLLEGESYFNSAEQSLMADSKITTNDILNGTTYTTTDQLYAPRCEDGTNVTVGEGDSLTIDKAYWAGYSWLRSPGLSRAGSGNALVAVPGGSVTRHNAYSYDPSLAAAFKLNLSSVLFTSAAPAASSSGGAGENFSQITAGTPMTLRLNGTGQGVVEPKLSEDKTTITVTGATQGDVLMVQGVDASGNNWCYSKTVDQTGNVTLSASTVAAAAAAANIEGFSLDSFDGCEVWLERAVTDGGTLTYATRASVGTAVNSISLNHTDYLGGNVTVNGQRQQIRIYDPNGVLPEGATLTAEAVTKHEYLDNDHEIEHLLAYNLSLLDANGNALPMPLSDTVELYFEVPEGFDKEELEVVLVNEFDDVEFEEDLVEIDGVTWVKVKTNHFSPYALIDTLSPEEKAMQAQENSGTQTNVTTEDQSTQTNVTTGDQIAGNKSNKTNVTTGDQSTQMTVAILCMTLVLSLGIMLRLITSKKKFEE